jgi:hypothetical protein
LTGNNWFIKIYKSSWTFFFSTTLFIFLFLFPLLAERAFASIYLNWQAPTTNTNGSSLTNLAGYRVYYGTGSPCSFANVIDVGNVHTYSLYLADGTYCLAVSAYNTFGAESSLSNTVYKTETSTYVDTTTCSNPKFKIGSTMYYYSAIQYAYDSSYSGSVLKIRAGDYDEDLTLQQDKSIVLDGGYRCDFASKPGYTVIHGFLKVSYGAVKVDRLIIK